MQKMNMKHDYFATILASHLKCFFGCFSSRLWAYSYLKTFCCLTFSSCSNDTSEYTWNRQGYRFWKASSILSSKLRNCWSWCRTLRNRWNFWPAVYLRLLCSSYVILGSDVRLLSRWIYSWASPWLIRLHTMMVLALEAKDALLSSREMAYHWNYTEAFDKPNPWTHLKIHLIYAKLRSWCFGVPDRFHILSSASDFSYSYPTAISDSTIQSAKWWRQYLGFIGAKTRDRLLWWRNFYIWEILSQWASSRSSRKTSLSDIAVESIFGTIRFFQYLPCNPPERGRPPLLMKNLCCFRCRKFGTHFVSWNTISRPPKIILATWFWYANIEDLWYWPHRCKEGYQWPWWRG